MKRARAGVLLLLFVLGMALAAPEARAATQASDKFVAKTDAQIIDVAVERGAERLRLEVILDVTAGSVAWGLYDSDGRLRAEGEAGEGGGSFRTEHLHPAAGAWRLRIQRNSATGRYRVAWSLDCADAGRTMFRSAARRRSSSASLSRPRRHSFRSQSSAGRAPLPALHPGQQAARFANSVRPPAASGTMWSSTPSRFNSRRQ